MPICDDGTFQGGIGQQAVTKSNLLGEMVQTKDIPYSGILKLMILVPAG